MKILFSFFKSGVLTLALAVLLFASVFFAMEKYGLYLSQMEKLETLKVRLRLSENQQSETNRRQRLFARVKTFLEQSQTLGLQAQKWGTYHVKIEEPVSFETFEMILNQCNTTSRYYFNPIHLQIKTEPASEKNQPQAGSRSPENGQDNLEDGDIFIDLKGSFLVRESI